MRRHRFITDVTFTTSPFFIEDAELVSQIQRVLRLKVGDALILADGAGQEAECHITDFGKHRIEVVLDRLYENTSEPAVATTLYCSLLKRENFELAVQKAVECGVSDIVPLVTERTVKFNMKEERVKKIIREASEQSGRGIVPQLHQILSYEEALEQSAHNTKNLFVHFGGERIDRVLQPVTGDRIGIFVGPEGGWSDREVARAQEKGFATVSLGARTLRAETAAIVATYLAVHADVL